MKKYTLLYSLLILFTLAVMSSCQSTNNYACKAKGYSTWYCSYQKPQASYRAMLR